MFGLSKNNPKPSLLQKLQQGLQRTRHHFSDLFTGKAIDDDLLEELETQLIMADVGIELSQSIIENLETQINQGKIKDSSQLSEALQQQLVAILDASAKPLLIPKKPRPYVVLMVGINGAGKTTTIGKLANQWQATHSVLLAAGDTFRAAAVEQLQVWGNRLSVPVIAQQTGADSASVIYDAYSSAQAKAIDIVLADTAGRLHTQNNLMAELQKVKRVLSKISPEAPHQTLLVIDGGTGQNALVQAKQFHQDIGLTGIVLTKLDGTAKGGIVFAIAQQLALPIYYIGIGEGVEDLRPFEPQAFVSALFEPAVTE